MAQKSPHISSSLGTQFARGVAWTGASSIVTSLIRLLIIAVLARLLRPEDFGLFSLTLIIVDFGNDIGDLGTGPTIIQHQNITQRLLSTVFWITLIGSVVLFVTAAILAPAFAWFFKEKQLANLIIVSSISFIIRAGGFMHRALLQKELKFNRIAIVEIGSVTVFGSVSVFLAMKGLGVWSLVYGLLAHRISDVILVWCVAQFRPTFDFDWNEARQVFSFARNITGERISYFFSARMDYIIIGRLLGPVMLGYYTLASEITSLPQKRIAAIVSTVSLPTFSLLQTQVESMRNAYERVNKTLSLVAFPLLAGLIPLSTEFVYFFYGKGWSQVVLPMQILCVAGAIRCIMHNNGAILYAMGRSDIALRWGVIQLVTIPIPLMIGSTYGLSAVAVALSITFLIYFIYIQNIINALIKLKFRPYLRNFLPALLGSFCMIGVLIVIRASLNILFPLNNLFILLAGSLAGSASYIAFIKILDRASWEEIKHLAQRVRPVKATG